MQLPRCCVGNFYELELALVSYMPLANFLWHECWAWRAYQGKARVNIVINVCTYFDGVRVTCMTRTVNGTGHTGTSEFCATSI